MIVGVWGDSRYLWDNSAWFGGDFGFFMGLIFGVISGILG